MFYEYHSQGFFIFIFIHMNVYFSCNSDVSGHGQKLSSYLQMKVLSEHDCKVTTLKLKTFH